MSAAKFNKDRGFTWDSDKSITLLSEEVAEFWNAYAEGDLVEMVDAWCDAKFVWEGRKYLFGSRKFDSVNSLDRVRAEFLLIRYYWMQQDKFMKDLLYKVGGITESALSEAFEIVCRANSRKALSYDAGLKVDKPEGWVPPQEEIRKLLLRRGVSADAL